MHQILLRSLEGGGRSRLMIQFKFYFCQDTSIIPVPGSARDFIGQRSDDKEMLSGSGESLSLKLMPIASESSSG